MYALIQRHKRLAALIIAVASLSFLFWMFSVADIKQMFGLQRCVALVGDECITLREYRFELMKYADLLDKPELRSAVKRQVLYSMVAREALYQEARSLGLIASDREVADAIKEDRSFHENGSFSLRRYRETLERLGLTPEEYELQLKKQLSIQKLLRVLEKGVYLTVRELDYRRDLLTKKLSGRLYLLTPARVKLSYRPTEEELRRYYEENRERFRRKADRVYRLWETEKKEEAHRLYSSLKEGKVPPGGRALKDPGDLPPEVRRELERLSEKNRYSLTKVKGSYYVVYLEETSADGILPFEEVRKEVEEALREEKAQELLEKKAYELAEKLRKGEEVNLKPVVFENSKAEEFSRLFGVGEEELVRIVFSRERVFGPYRTAGGFAVVYVERRLPGGEVNVKAIREGLLRSKFNSLVDLYVDRLLRSAGVKLNEELIDR